MTLEKVSSPRIILGAEDFWPSVNEKLLLLSAIVIGILVTESVPRQDPCELWILYLKVFNSAV